MEFSIKILPPPPFYEKKTFLSHNFLLCLYYYFSDFEQGLHIKIYQFIKHKFGEIVHFSEES